MMPVIDDKLAVQAAGSAQARDLFSAHFMRGLLKHRIWLAGEVLDLLGFFLQALALKFGSLTIVAPLMTTNLIFLLLILHRSYSLPLHRRELGGGLAICGGVSLLLVVARPRGGHAQFEALPWLIAGCVVGGLVIASAVLVRRTAHSGWRAAIAGTAAGVNFALTAALTKLVVDQLDGGIWAVASGWEVWALMASGTVAFVAMQSAYGAGPLAISTPAMQIFDPLIGVIFGITLFGDFINLSPLAIALEIVSALVIAGGIIALTGSRRIQQYSNL
jgi:drug/metabolite transporter (DMT)-like permease